MTRHSALFTHTIIMHLFFSECYPKYFKVKVNEKYVKIYMTKPPLEQRWPASHPPTLLTNIKRALHNSRAIP